MDYIFWKISIGSYSDWTMSGLSIDVGKYSAISINEFVEMNEFISLFLSLIK